MESFCAYRSPLGEITLSTDGDALTGLRFVGQKHYVPPRTGSGRTESNSGRSETRPASGRAETPILKEACAWLDLYFHGVAPDFTPRLNLRGTDFQKAVWDVLLSVPYGHTASYGEIAAAVSERQGRRTSARAVGAAVGRNPVALIVPCHRIIGADGTLTGYAAGLDKKSRLLEWEGVDMTKLRIR